uniref:Cesa8 n=1 Tax=Arundo donax TaxID=35708 RepID=A0A0A9E107_ARUDO
MRGRRRGGIRRGALRGVQRVRLPRLPRLLRVRAPRGLAGVPAVQDPLQAPQRVPAGGGRRGGGRRGRPGGRVRPAGWRRPRGRPAVRRRVHAAGAHELRPRRRRAPLQRRPQCAAPHQRPDGRRHPAGAARAGAVLHSQRRRREEDPPAPLRRSEHSSATEIHGPVQGSGRLRLRERGLEGEDGGLEAEAGAPAAAQE